MNQLKTYSDSDIKYFVNKRDGETKLGEALKHTSSLKDVSLSSAKYVLFGIPEDIGIRANFGKPGARDTWHAFLKAFLNIQVNRYNNPDDVLLLGALDCEVWLKKASSIEDKDPNFSAKLHDIVKEIDAAVCNIVEAICELGKIPIIIGGGHNNAFGNLKGLSKARHEPINVLNIDAHTDLRTTDFRHSGNGFSAALEEGYVDHYTVFGLHKNYTPHYIFEEIATSDKLEQILFEDLINDDLALKEYKKALSKMASKPFGLEIDCDAIANFPSSAKTPIGFTLEQIRQFIEFAKQESNLGYVHICEATPSEHFNTGKALSYIVSEIIQK